MQEETNTLLDRLRSYAARDTVPLHMPGHKRNLSLAPYLKELGGGLDITELAGFDDLHAPNGVLKDGMERAARLWGSEHSFFLVNGSSGGLLAGIRAATKRGDRVLVARNCHKAVYHALELCGLEPVYLLPPTVPEFGFFGSLGVRQVAHALRLHPEVRLLILTSPTYEGVISDVAGLCRLAHAHGIPVLVDEAHGAHLGFHPVFSGGAVAAGADVVVQSLHKTLPSLTQTAIAHVNGSLVSAQEMARQLGVFQTSSPSYLFLASMDACIDLLETRGPMLFDRWVRRLADFDRAILGLKHLRIFGHGREKERREARVFAFDPSKLPIYAAGNGKWLMTSLRKRFHIEMELSLEDETLAMTGLGDAPNALPRLAGALSYLDRSLPQQQAAAPPALALPERRLAPDAAMQHEWKLIPAAEAIGQVSAEYVWAYPPGIPLIAPGEVFSQPLMTRLMQMHAHGVNLIATRGIPAEQVAALDRGK